MTVQDLIEILESYPDKTINIEFRTGIEGQRIYTNIKPFITTSGATDEKWATLLLGKEEA